MPFQGKVALVTGASRNIGRATALAFAREGVDVALHGHSDTAGLAATAGLVEKLGVKAFTVTADLSIPTEAARVVREAERALGKVDILVNNAALRNERPTLEMKPEEWRRVLAIDLDAPFFCAQAALRGMVERRWGRIISLSGQAGYRGHNERAHVAAAKLGIVGMSRALATEFGKYGITVNCVCPGSIATERQGPVPQGTLQRQTADSPVERQGLPEEIAAACVYLASDAAAFVTGHALQVNGGVYYQ